MVYEIFANHAHIFMPEVREDGTVDALLRLMDACGIDRCVGFAPFPSQAQGQNANQWLDRATTAHRDRLIRFGTVDFERDDPEAQVREIHELGFPGIKLHPAYQHFHLTGEKAMRVYREAEARGLFLTFHTGIHWHRIRDYQVLLHDEIAYNFPKLRFSMEHMGGYCFFHEALAVLINNQRKEQRLYAGMTSVSAPESQRYWYLSDERVRDLIWQAGDDCLIFGLDFPYNGLQETLASMKRFRDMGLAEGTLEKLFGGNLRRALRMEEGNQRAGQKG